ncbi:putative peptidoglycan lipid II flippase [Eubacterium ruminantium]|uniref:Probable lipid II flippase MurJ n=1 Tax=Eubacterium ruminantium TaxID=42322 RepID=A0A1T4KJD2_9FIRM|nr:murein biosynthesis integral membrane protein MurJ [Eubacterium ruminantium]SCW32564.1 putative peptidoglycan lipid II flippase [Eubacterium ruminantium]SDM28390.1 putative peptidoglycan lipid II flippase [Eubacterium ruminantium]SJZ42542.1 putative peptidoglycan lipid II flippase [Eubacterium ruminantium]
MSEVKKQRGQSFVKATTIMAVLSLVSSFLGIVRNMVMNAIFGLGTDQDCYQAAFLIPDLIFMMLVGGALSSAFIPIFSVYISNGEDDKGYRMASTIMNLAIIFAFGLCLIGEIFTPQLMRIITKLTGDRFWLAVKLTRIMFFQCFFMCLCGVAQGICQSYRNFTPSSVGGALYTSCTVGIGYFLWKFFGFGIEGFAIGVVIGALVNFLVHIRPMKKEGFRYYPKIDLKQEGVRKFFGLFWPMLLGISVTQINQVVIKRFGSGLGDSVLSAMGNATTITELPVTLFGATISLAVFPAMSQHYASGQVDEYKKDLSLSMRTMMFITIPASAGLMAIREPLIRALYRQGMFTEENVHAVSVLMIFYIIGIVGYCCRSVFSRGFYAINETKVPVRINITILTLNIILSMIFVKFWKAKGLALAYSVAGLCSMTLLGFFLKRRIGNMRGREMFVSFIKSLIGSCVMFIALIPIRNYLMDVMPPDRKLIQIAHVAILITIGAIIYAVMALILRMQEVSAVTDFMKKKFKKKKA